MSSLICNLPEWVRNSPSGDEGFRQAVHIILDTIAEDSRLSELLCLKGGILMALHYESQRHTTDIDFSTDKAFSLEAEEEIKALIERRLAEAADRMPYDTECRLQRWKVQPGRDKTFVTIQMKVGYAARSTKEHARLLNGSAARTVSIDYSYLESIPQFEEISIGSDGVLRVYAIQTLVAEKIRSLLQQPIRGRNRRQDVFDLHHLLNTRQELYSQEYKDTVLQTIIIKCGDREVPVDQNAFENAAIHDMALADYHSMDDEVEGDLPDFEAAFAQIKDYFRQLPWS